MQNSRSANHTQPPPPDGVCADGGRAKLIQRPLGRRSSGLKHIALMIHDQCGINNSGGCGGYCQLIDRSSLRTTRNLTHQREGCTHQTDLFHMSIEERTHKRHLERGGPLENLEGDWTSLRSTFRSQVFQKDVPHLSDVCLSVTSVIFSLNLIMKNSYSCVKLAWQLIAQVAEY